MQLTLGVFFSVFLLTRTGLSYFTREEFGGIIFVKQKNVYQYKQGEYVVLAEAWVWVLSRIHKSPYPFWLIELLENWGKQQSQLYNKT